MDTPDVERTLKSLESRWLEAAKSVDAARTKLATVAAQTCPAETLTAVQEQLETAERAKRGIMGQIDAIEDGLVFGQ
jgi:hypothetical protein